MNTEKHFTQLLPLCSLVLPRGEDGKKSPHPAGLKINLLQQSRPAKAYSQRKKVHKPLDIFNKNLR